MKYLGIAALCLASCHHEFGKTETKWPPIANYTVRSEKSNNEMQILLVLKEELLESKRPIGVDGYRTSNGTFTKGALHETGSWEEGEMNGKTVRVFSYDSGCYWGIADPGPEYSPCTSTQRKQAEALLNQGIQLLLER
jgi:hypothetical protein